jgi:bacteriorhodopsin
MWPLLATIGPRILIPSFFIGQKVSTMTDYGQISQTIAFSFLFICFALNLFTDHAWISVIPGVAAWAYWNMMHDKENMEKYRYTDWAITTPFMLLALLVVNKTSAIYTAGIIIADLIMIATGYLGALASEFGTKIAFFTVGCVAFIPILYTLFTLKKAKLAVYLTILTWILYPIVWYMDEDSIINKQTTTVTYSVMDVVAKVGLVSLLRI